jgi:hypothetical protein
MSKSNEIKRKFFNSLKRGTGESYLILIDNPTIDFSEYIIKCCLKNFSYDGQCEPNRAQYLFEHINISINNNRIIKEILKGLATEHKDTWNLTQLFALSKILAQNGNKEAGKAIYKRFLNNPIEGSEWVGYDEIFNLDGFKGLVFIAEKFGKYLLDNPGNWHDDSIINHFQNENPEINVLDELNNLSKSNKLIRVYLECIKDTENNVKNYESKKLVFSNIIEEVLFSKPLLSYKRRKELNENELLEIANQLLIEKNTKNIEKLLNVFTNKKFPLESKFILDLAKQKTSQRNRINEFAIYSLKFLKSDEIREFALEKIQTSKQPELFIEILNSNYKKGDYKILSFIAKNIRSEHKIESIANSFVQIFKENKTPECKEPLEILYSKMNCGLHRKHVIEILIDNNVLSEKIRKEIIYDSNLETRNLIIS